MRTNGAEPPAADAEAAEAVERIRRRGVAIRDEQVDRALSRLAAEGEVTPAERAAVERLADRLTAHLQEFRVATALAVARHMNERAYE